MLPSAFWLIALIVLLVGEAITIGLTFVWFAVGALGALIVSVLEAATVGLVSLWFAVGSLCALLTSFFVGNIWVQFAVFLAVSFLCLVIIRPLAKKYADPRRVSTNADRVIGQTAVVTEQIDNLSGTGQVNVAGQIWSARSAHDVVIPRETEVRVLKISGVKVLVEAI